MKKHYHLLDLLRFFAAFWVMNFHFLFGQTGDLEWYRYGNLGVQVFFIVSGFVIVQSLRGKSTRQFAENRFIRLFPLFWILCTFTYIVTLITPGATAASFAEYLQSMTMFGDLFNKIVGYSRLIDPSYWSLTVELIFYLGIGVFARYFTYDKIRYFFVGWLILSATAFLLHIDHNFYVKLLLVRHAAYFAFGGALSLIANNQANTVREKNVDWILLFSSAIFATLMHPRALEPYYVVNPLDIKIISVLHIAFFLVIPALVFLSGKIRDAKTIRFLTIVGGITYPLYLLHQRIGNVLMNFVVLKYERISWAHLSIGFEFLMIFVAYFVYLADKKLRVWLTQKYFQK